MLAMALGLSIIATGCATKKYVAKTIAPVEQRVGATETKDTDQDKTIAGHTTQLGEFDRELSQTKERVTTAFKLILSDPNVEGVLVNIFGGIMRCDVIAEGVIAAAREVSLHVPLVVRLEGTNVELGKKILAESGLKIVAADNLADAAEKIVQQVKDAA